MVWGRVRVNRSADGLARRCRRRTCLDRCPGPRCPRRVCPERTLPRSTRVGLARYRGMQVAVNKQHVLFGAAYQLDARLGGMHQGAIRRKIVAAASQESAEASRVAASDPGARACWIRTASMPDAGAIIARRPEPGARHVPRSNPSGLTIWLQMNSRLPVHVLKSIAAR
jgi:hypothetical protein